MYCRASDPSSLTVLAFSMMSAGRSTWKTCPPDVEVSWSTSTIDADVVKKLPDFSEKSPRTASLSIWKGKARP